MIEVKINGITKWQVNEYTFTDPQMGIRSISLTVTHPSDNATVPSFVGAYVEYEGERYDIVNSKPTAEKGIDSINYKYNLIFYGQEAELQRRKIRNLATVGVDAFISQGTSFSLYADINQFKQLLENNLKYYFGNRWTINLGSTTSESVMVSVNNMFIWDLLLKTFEYYGLRWNITGNTINIGYIPDVIQHVFDYGYNGGLVKITRTAQSEPTINRLVGVGGSRNVPINYFTNRYSDFPVDPNPISGDVNIKNIMPKVFRDSVIAGTLPYIDYVEDAALVASDGVKEDALEPNEDIYPSIAGVEVAGLGRIDQIIAASVPTANNPDDAGYSPTFDIWVKDIGFDLADNQYTATQDAKISFTSGMLAGYEFVILATNGVRNVVVDTTKSHGGVSSKYKITLINSSEDFTATGRMLPNSVIKAMPGDSFVIYDIIMPQSYVELAELRVQNWLNEQLDIKKVEKPTYAIEPTDTFFEENIAPESDGKTIREKLKSGNKLTVNNTKVTDGAQELHINNITIQYGGLLPKYSFVVTDKVSVQGSAIARLTNEIQKTDNSVQATDKKIVKLQQYSDRQWKEIHETITLLGAAIDGFSTGINPITVQTMQLLVGNESLQFRFVSSKTTPVAVSHAFNWDDVLKSFTTTSGIIQHMTLGITEISSNHPVSAYKFWDIASYSNNTLVAEKPYYLYSKCSRTTSGAVFLLSDVPIGMYDDANYYYFLTGILNSEDSNGGRSFVSLYGFTEILPGRITTDKIVSSDGLTYFDLLNGVIGGKIRFASTGGGETNLDDWADGTSQDIQDAQAAANAAALLAQQAIDEAEANVTLINQETAKLQAQIDGEVSNWFYPYTPTLANYPASDWTTNAIKDRHIGDTFTNTQPSPAADAGKSWRFVKNGSTYSWTQIADSDAVKALQQAAQAQATADGKSTTFLVQPSNYHLGDTWVLNADRTVNGTAYKQGEILTATQDSTTFVEAHWIKRVRYTDDTAVNNLQIGARNLIIRTTETLNTWINVSGDVVSASNHSTSDYIAVTPDTSYMFSKSDSDLATDSGFFRYAWYDEDKNYIGRAANYANEFQWKSPIDVYFVRISYPNDSFPKFEKGAKATDWSPAPEDVQAEIDAAVVKATYWSIKASSPVIYKDAINAGTSGAHTTAVVSGELRSGTTTTSGGFITVTPNGGTEAGTATASPATIAPADSDGKTSYTVKLYDTASKTTLLDTMTIPVVFKGASGVNAISAVLSNEADVLPASPEGVVSDYSGSGTEIRVFEGATELSYGTSNGQYQVSAVGSGITVGTPSTSGNRRVYGVASNMTSDNATITFTITGKTASGASFSLTKVQAFAKSRTGQKGDTGAVGQGVESVTEEYAISTSKTVQPTTGWSTTQPSWINGQYIWSRVKVVYKNPASTVYTGYAVSSEWEAVNELKIGTVNLLNNSCKFRTAGWNGGFASNGGGYTIDNDVLFNGSPTLKTTVGYGLVHSWLKLENNVEYTYSAMVRANADFTGWSSVPLHFHAGYNNRDQSKITILKYDQTVIADEWKLIYTTFKLTQDADSFRPFIYGPGSTIFNIAFLGLVKGNRPLLQASQSDSDVQASIFDAKQAGIDAQGAVSNLGTYVDGAFKDGVIDAAEAKAIEKSINLVNETMAKAEASYNKVYTNTYLEGTAKTNLLNAKINLWGQRDTLLSAINTAIAGGTTTPAQKTAVDNAFATFNTLMTAFQNALEDANKAIQNKLKGYSDTAQSTADTAKLTAEQAQLAADGYMRARYIRDWSGRNTTNNFSAWNEVKVFLKNGTNIAQGKSVTGRRAQHATNVYSNVTDNNISNTGQPSSSVPEGETDWVRIDLGQVYYDIDYIQVWHFWSDGRTYYGTKTEISEDGVNWTTIFDSAVSGTYQETKHGKVHTYRPSNVLAKLNTSAAITDKFKTTINGGLINTVTMELREADTENVTAGISGIQNGGNGVAFWAGGTYAQAIAGTAKAIIRHDGTSKFTETEITGIIDATSGFLGTLEMKSGGYIDLPPTFASRKGRLDNAGLQLVYQSGNSQKIEWYSGLGTYAGQITCNSSGRMQLSSSFGVGIGLDIYGDAITITAGAGFYNNINLNSSVVSNIRQLLQVGILNLNYTSHSLSASTNYHLSNDTTLIVLTSVGDGAGIYRITNSGGSSPSNGDVRIIVNTSPTNYAILKDGVSGGNIRVLLDGGPWFRILQNSIAVLVYYGGYWRIHTNWGQPG